MKTRHCIDNDKEEKKENAAKISRQSNFDAKRKTEDRVWRRREKNEKTKGRRKGRREEERTSSRTTCPIR